MYALYGELLYTGMKFRILYAYEMQQEIIWDIFKTKQVHLKQT